MFLEVVSAIVSVVGPVFLMVTFLYSDWHQKGRNGPFMDVIRYNLFALSAFALSVIVLALSFWRQNHGH